MSRSETDSVTVSRRGSAPDDRDADCTIVWLHGEHDLTTKVPVAAAIARAARRDDADLLVDLSDVTFMDASTVGALVGSRDLLLARSQSLLVRSPSPWAFRILDVCGLADLVLRGRTAAALGSWVDVPATGSLRGATDPSGASELLEPARPAPPVDARRISTAIEADRGGP